MGPRNFATASAIAVLVLTAEAYPCSIVGEISNLKLVNEADAIVRATAVDYALRPRIPALTSAGVPSSKVRFKIVESIRGGLNVDLILPGELVNEDDFNDHPPPYNFVRRAGRRGNCFAGSYRAGAQFLLFLKKADGGELTVYWYGLAPVNEQLHSEQDPWLVWVRDRASGR